MTRELRATPIRHTIITNSRVFASEMPVRPAAEHRLLFYLWSLLKSRPTNNQFIRRRRPYLRNALVSPSSSSSLLWMSSQVCGCCLVVGSRRQHQQPEASSHATIQHVLHSRRLFFFFFFSGSKLSCQLSRDYCSFPPPRLHPFPSALPWWTSTSPFSTSPHMGRG